jgi:hypothetical protein
VTSALLIRHQRRQGEALAQQQTFQATLARYAVWAAALRVEVGAYYRPVILVARRAGARAVGVTVGGRALRRAGGGAEPGPSETFRRPVIVMWCFSSQELSFHA